MRLDDSTHDELSVAQKYFEVYTSRSIVPKDSLIIPRYSALPYYKELETDAINLGSKLINSYQQFNFIANFEYYDILKAYTFKTYFNPAELPEGQYVVKGLTNSRKHQWNSMCFAKDRKTAIDIGCELKYDSLIGQQSIIYREYHKLKTFEYLVNGLPVTNEWRFFCYKRTILSYGYYWSNALNPKLAELDMNAFGLVDRIASIIGTHSFNNFYTIDIAQLENGSWLMVELNSGEMAGLSMVNVEQLYSTLERQVSR
jgi:hypothetical protein